MIVPPEVLHSFGLEPNRCRAVAIEIGLINHTWRVETPAQPRILQRLHPIFAPEVNLDIEAITEHIESRGMVTPRLFRTTADELWARDADGGVWRMMTFLDGRIVATITEPWMAQGAGEIAGRFHRAVSDLDHRFHFERPGAHDTPAHMARLEATLRDLRTHRAYDAVAPTASDILEHAKTLEPLPTGPRRIIHGDLKVTNVLFDNTGLHARALLDLDTMAHLPLAIEMGDALRSWCNPAGESAESASFDAAIFESAVRAYASAAGELVTPDEQRAIVAGAETIALELSARFCADALNESYFGWDNSRFASRSEHNLVRARSQHSVAHSVRSQRSALEQIVDRAFGR